MKGFGLIGMLLAMLIAAWLMMQRLGGTNSMNEDQQKAADEAGIKTKKVQDLPNVFRNKIKDAMKKDAERQKDMLEGIE